MDTKPRAILIVEDELQIRQMIRATLMRNGFLTLEASSGPKALSVARCYEGQIEVAIVDLIMPGMGGLDFANQLGVDRPGTKILYISEFAESIAVESVERSTPQAILKKPFNGRDLMTSVRALIRESRVTSAEAL